MRNYIIIYFVIINNLLFLKILSWKNTNKKCPKFWCAHKSHRSHNCVLPIPRISQIDHRDGSDRRRTAMNHELSGHGCMACTIKCKSNVPAAPKSRRLTMRLSTSYIRAGVIDLSWACLRRSVLSNPDCLAPSNNDVAATTEMPRHQWGHSLRSLFDQVKFFGVF